MCTRTHRHTLYRHNISFRNGRLPPPTPGGRQWFTLEESDQCSFIYQYTSQRVLSNVHELLKNLHLVSMSDLCSFCRPRMWIRVVCGEGRMICSTCHGQFCRELSLSFSGVLEINHRQGPHALNLPSWAYYYMVASFLLGSSLGPHGNVIDSNMLLPFPGSSVCPSSLRSSLCLRGLGAKITLESLLLANSFHDINIYILYYF